MTVSTAINLGLPASLLLNPEVIGGADPAVLIPQLLRTNASWQGQFQQRMLVVDGVTYVQTMGGKHTGGIFDIHRIRDRKIDTFQVIPARNTIGADDHNMNGIIELSGGKLMYVYLNHGDSSGPHYRVTNSALPDLEDGWADEVIIPLPSGVGATSASYAEIFKRSDGMVYLKSRIAATTSGYFWFKAPEADIAAGTATWTAERMTTNAGSYAVGKQTGDRIDFCNTTGNPGSAVGACSVTHFYILMDSGGDTYHKSDGTAISAPFDTTDKSLMTLVYDATPDLANARIYDTSVDGSGNPRCVYAYSASFNGTDTGAETDVSLAFARWTGSAWQSTTFRTDDWSMPDTNLNHQCGEGSFDGNDPSKFLIAMRDDATDIHEIFELTITDGAGSDVIATTAQLTTGSTYHQAKPFSPAGWVNGCRAAWYERVDFATFSNFYCRTRFYGLANDWTAASYDSDAATYFTTASQTNVIRKNIIDQAIVRLKSGAQSGSNIWAKLQQFTLPCLSESLAMARYDIKGLNQYTQTGTPGFAAGAGVKGDVPVTAHISTPAVNTLTGYSNTSFAHGGITGRGRDGTVTQIAATVSGSAVNLLRADNSGIRNHEASGTIPSPWTKFVGSLMAVSRTGTTVERHIGNILAQSVTNTASSAQTVGQAVAHSAQGYVQAYFISTYLTAAEIRDVNVAIYGAVRAIGADDEDALAELLAQAA
jgi:hypothetical protein